MTHSIQARGTIHGKTIELDEPVLINEGEVVEIMILRRLPPKAPALPPGEGLRLSAGSWPAEDEELDEYLEWNRQQRKYSRPEIEP